MKWLMFCRLCLSISDFHPDTWNPAWSVSTILTGLLSFMVNRSLYSVYLSHRPTALCVRTLFKLSVMSASNRSLYSMSIAVFPSFTPNAAFQIFCLQVTYMIANMMYRVGKKVTPFWYLSFFLGRCIMCAVFGYSHIIFIK